MQVELLPLFPLRVVLFPRTLLPLHIFEERYKEMIGEAIALRSDFGVVFARDKGIAQVGCTASVREVIKRYADGRMAITATGGRRFEILSLNEEKSYLRAAVSFFDDDEQGGTPNLGGRAVAAYRAMRELDAEEVLQEPVLDDPQLSFQLAQHLPDPELRQTLLQMRSERERLEQIVAYLDEYVPAQRRISHVRSVAPRNGHGLFPSQSRHPS